MPSGEKLQIPWLSIISAFQHIPQTLDKAEATFQNSQFVNWYLRDCLTMISNLFKAELREFRWTANDSKSAKSNRLIFKYRNLMIWILWKVWWPKWVIFRHNLMSTSTNLDWKPWLEVIRCDKAWALMSQSIDVEIEKSTSTSSGLFIMVPLL